jgi:hypothetical protein
LTCVGGLVVAVEVPVEDGEGHEKSLARAAAPIPPKAAVTRNGMKVQSSGCPYPPSMAHKVLAPKIKRFFIA